MPTGLTKIESNLMQNYIHMFGPIKEATELLSGDTHPISSSYIPSVAAIKNGLKEELKKSKKKNLGNHLFESIKRRFKFIKTNETLQLATMLGPRYKDCYFDKKSKKNMQNQFLKIASFILMTCQQENLMNSSLRRIPLGTGKCQRYLITI